MLSAGALALAAVLAFGLAAPVNSAVPANSAPAGATPAQAPPGTCEITGAEVVWGFAESLRSRVPGAGGLGTWRASGEVSYDAPRVSFRGGEGFVAPDLSRAAVGFDGEFRFSVVGGFVSTAFANPRLRFDGPREATLFVDISGSALDLAPLELRDVAFVTLQWPASRSRVDARAGTWDISRASATLTAAGSQAYGTFLTGEVFDPMDISLQVAPGCLEHSGLRLWWVAGVLSAIGLVVGLVLWLWLWRRRQADTSSGEPGLSGAPGEPGV